MSAVESKTDRRKKNFSPEEKAVLISAIERYDVFLHGAKSRDTSRARKQVILETIASDVSALGNESRTYKDINKKISGLRRHVREKVAAIKKHQSGTGGGPPCNIILTPDEGMFARCLQRKQLEGVEGFDSGDDASRTGKCFISPIRCVACEGVEGNL